MTRPLLLTDEELGYHPRFRPKRFRGLVQFHGREVTLEREAMCACFKVADPLGNEAGTLLLDTSPAAEIGGERPSDCPDCGGTGSAYVYAGETLALVTGDARSGFRARDGAADSGDAMFSFLPEAMPASLDRIVLMDAFEKFKELTKRRGVVDRLRYPILSRVVVSGAASRPTDPDFSTEGVIYLQVAGADGYPDGTARAEGIDFDITPDGLIDWTRGDILGTAPAVGAAYTVTAWTRARYVVDATPGAHRAQTTDYPTQHARTARGSTQMLVRVKARLEIAGAPPGTTT